MRERGSALLTAVIMVMVLIFISGIFFTTLIYQAKNESSEERGLKAYYLAEAGVQYAIAEIWNGSLDRGGPFNSDNLDDSMLGGRFEGKVTKNGTDYTIESTGYYGSNTERVIKVSYTYVQGSGGSGGGSGYEEIAPDYPAWTPQFYDPGALVNSTNDEGNLTIFYNVWDADASQVIGTLWGPWQEITTKWKPYNNYWKNDIVTFNETKYLNWNITLGPERNKQPGDLWGPWQELTNEWRETNYYDTGDIVIYDNKLFRAKWYSYNNRPGSSDVWESIPILRINPPVFLGVMVSPKTASIQVGETKATFTAKAIYSDGAIVDVTDTAVWSSSDPNIATMTNGGVATGVNTDFFRGFFEKHGNSKVLYPVDTPTPIPISATIPITATFNGKVGTAYLTVEGSSSGTGTPAEGFLWEKEIEETE